MSRSRRQSHSAVSASIPAQQAKKMVDVSGLYVLPGLWSICISMSSATAASISPDDTALMAGTTTVVDAGGSGWRTFDKFRSTVIAHSQTRVLAFLNIVGAGMVGEAAESNTADMDSQKTADMIMKNRDVIVGIKTAHFGLPGWFAIDHAVEAGRIAQVPVMVDDKIFTDSGRTTRDKLLEHLRPGDIHTHMFNDRQVELVDRFTGKVQPYIYEARNRGVIFDLGHGAGSFLWPVASKAIAQGFYPDSISTDLHGESIMLPQPDMPNCMSKLMLLGMTLNDVVLRSTVNPAKEIHRFPELGTLGVGKGADIAVLDLQHGVFAFKDAWDVKRLSPTRLDCAMTVRDGKVVFDRDGRAFPLSTGLAAPTTISPSPNEQQIFDLLLKNGHVIDPVNGRDERMDIAVTGNKITKVGHDLPAAHARTVIDAASYYVTPGLIDVQAGVHAHYETLRFGVTTAIEKGANQLRTAGASLSFRKAMPEVKSGVLPAVIVSGMNLESTALVQPDLATTMSKFLNMGMTVNQVFTCTTKNAAQAIGRPELGTLSEGSIADVAIFDLQHGKFGFIDALHERLDGDKRLRCILTVRAGKVVWDTEGLASTDASRAGPYSNFK